MTEGYKELETAIKEMKEDFHIHLSSLREDFSVHSSQLQNHLDHFQRHEREELIRHQQALLAQESNTDAINKLAKSTEGLVTTWQTANNIGRFFKWLGGTAVSMTAIAIAIKEFL